MYWYYDTVWKAGIQKLVILIDFCVWSIVICKFIKPFKVSPAWKFMRKLNKYRCFILSVLAPTSDILFVLSKSMQKNSPKSSTLQILTYFCCRFEFASCSIKPYSTSMLNIRKNRTRIWLNFKRVIGTSP